MKANDISNDILYEGYNSLLTGAGVSSCILQLKKFFPYSKVLTLRNVQNTPLYGNEISLNAHTKFNEVYFVNPKKFLLILKTIKNSKIIHFNPFNFSESFLGLLSKFMNKKVLSTFHSNINLSNNRIIEKIENLRTILVYNFFLLISEKIIFLTNAQREIFSKKCLFTNLLNKKSIIINNFIDQEYIIKQKKSNFNRLNILFVGRIEKKKGAQDLLSVASSLKNEKIFFNLIGSGNLEKNIYSSNNISLIGKISKDKIQYYYDKSDILILPSYAEVFPMTILEAMARGLVILVSDIPGMKEIVKEGRNGFLFQPGDIEKMKEIILYLKSHPEEIKRISENNLKDIHKFTAEKQIKRHIKLYYQLLNKNDKTSI